MINPLFCQRNKNPGAGNGLLHRDSILRFETDSLRGGAGPDRGASSGILVLSSGFFLGAGYADQGFGNDLQPAPGYLFPAAYAHAVVSALYSSQCVLQPFDPLPALLEYAGVYSLVVLGVHPADLADAAAVGIALGLLVEVGQLGENFINQVFDMLFVVFQIFRIHLLQYTPNILSE